MTDDPEKKPHHHGNLREALIEAGLDILATEGLSKLTLRACAARAGVSHSAPAHHFGGLPGLLTAIAARGYRIFTRTMMAARSSADPAPRAQVIAICHGYLAFADAHPALFTLMFNAPAQITPDTDFAEASDAAYQVLADTCAPFAPVTDDPRSTEVMIWSLVHGLASLQQGRRLKASQNAPPIPDFEAILPPLALRNRN